MSGLLINFYQVEIEQKTIVAKVLNYSEYETKEKYIAGARTAIWHFLTGVAYDL